jgi:hypothetical protein
MGWHVYYTLKMKEIVECLSRRGQRKSVAAVGWLSCPHRQLYIIDWANQNAPSLASKTTHTTVSLPVHRSATRQYWNRNITCRRLYDRLQLRIHSLTVISVTSLPDLVKNSLFRTCYQTNRNRLAHQPIRLAPSAQCQKKKTRPASEKSRF